MARRQKIAKRPKPKTVLRLPDLEQSKNAVFNSLAAVSFQESYGHAIEEFITALNSALERCATRVWFRQGWMTVAGDCALSPMSAPFLRCSSAAPPLAEQAP